MYPIVYTPEIQYIRYVSITSLIQYLITFFKLDPQYPTFTHYDTFIRSLEN